jgi:Fe-S oxidoreductase
MGTYVMYAIHLAVAVPMLVIEVPFGKWSHLFYRPLAMFLATVKEKASVDSKVDVEDLLAEVGETFMGCMQCGTCTGVCPWNQVSSYSPRQILRQLTLGSGTEQGVDEAVWGCVTCNACGVNCPRGIDIIDVMRAVREFDWKNKTTPRYIETPLNSLKNEGNPWGGAREDRMRWSADLDIPEFKKEHEYCLFTCCTTAYETNNRESSRALPQLLKAAGVSFGSLGVKESCCADPALHMGAEAVSSELIKKNTDLFLISGVEKMITASPHCLNTFKKYYSELPANFHVEHHSEVLAGLMEEGRFGPLRPVVRTITYHDPCYLGRHNGIYEAPRRILQNIPGLRLIEMENNRENSLCCGGGGGGAWNEQRLNQNLGVLRIQEALRSGAEMIVTACPYCIRMLNDAVNKLGVKNRIVVGELAQLLWASVGVTSEVYETNRVEMGLNQEAYHG